eukprot:2964893-Prymnesium_polylepis.1
MQPARAAQPHSAWRAVRRSRHGVQCTRAWAKGWARAHRQRRSMWTCRSRPTTAHPRSSASTGRRW